MRVVAVGAVLAALLGACRSKDPGDAIGGDRLALPPAHEPAPRKRPAELAYLTLKVVGMT